MKKIIAILLSLFALQSGHAVDYPYCEGSSSPCCKQSTYIKLGGTSIFLGSEKGGWAPAVSLGRRYASDEAAVDFSLMASYQSKHTYFYQLPRLVYLLYHSPRCDQSLYYGVGVSWIYTSKEGKKVEEEKDGVIVTRRRCHKFNGIAAEATLGYELSRHSDFTTFLELDLSQPLLKVLSDHARYSPSLTLAFGVGF